MSNKLLTILEEVEIDNQKDKNPEPTVLTLVEEKHNNIEKRYKLLAEHSDDIVWTMSMNFKLTFVSPSIERVFGYTVDEFMQKPLRGFLTKHSYDDLMDKLVDALDNMSMSLDTEKGFDILEIEAKKKNGEKIWLETRIVILKDENDRPIGLLGTSKDITQKKDLEQQLRQAQKMEAVGQLASGIAHDFNNVLTAIFGYTQMMSINLSEDNDTSNFNEYIEEINSATDKGGALVRQLLAFTKRKVLKPTELCLNIVVNEMKSMLHGVLDKRIELVTILDPELKNITADRSQIEQIILNLIVNSRDAIEENGHIVVKTEEINASQDSNLEIEGIDANSKYVKLTISDIGKGMNKEVIDRIFEPFYSTKENKGTGLGLSTVFGIVKRNNGIIKVNSEEGKWTAFQIYFPIID